MSSTDQSTPAQLLRRFGLRPVKGLGQHFLTDSRVTDSIIGALRLSEGDTVLEIGPGLGALTGPLLDTGAQVIAVERDARLAEVLPQVFPGQTRLSITQGDILDTDLGPLIGDRRPAVAGNLPYNISAPVVFHLLRYTEATGPWVLMFQKEVAQRLRANPGGPGCGVVTALVAPFRDVQTVTAVGRGAFHPPPGVDSEVVRLDPRNDKPLGDVPYEVYRRVVRAAFGSRRKTLRNALRNGGIAEGPELLAQAGIDPTRRGETLSVAEFVALAQGLGSG
jgi:16S rRNA (adenine1518-N6/adenine1519-N6)-dimethyltransferase